MGYSTTVSATDFDSVYERSIRSIPAKKTRCKMKNSDVKIVSMNIDLIKPYEKNPRHNDDAVQPVAKSIKSYGFKVPIVVDKNNVIITGHTRYRAALLLGLNTVPVIIADDLTPKEVKAFRIADNKVSDFSIFDNKLLLEELDGLDDLFTGFDFSGLDNMAVLDEKDNSVIEDNEYGLTYEVVLRSEDKAKIEKIKAIWDAMENE